VIGREALPRVAAPRDGGGNLSPVVVFSAGGFLLAMLAASLYDIKYLSLAMIAVVAVCAGLLVVNAPIACSAVWLVIAGSSPEMWLGEMMPGDESTITAVVKMLGLVLVAVCMVRYGARFDALNPALAFCVMFLVGMLHGLYPTMTTMDSVRSLIGAAAPFAFLFARPSRRWCNAMVTATIWTPLAIVLFGVLLQVVGARPLFTALEGRLEGSTHPAFLGGFAMAGIYAALVELYRDGRGSRIWAIVLNFAILILSGARAPLAYALIVTGSAFLLLKSDAFSARRRVPLILGGALLLPVMIAIATGGTSSLRLLNVLSSEAGDLSGRDIIWPYFQAAWSASPVFGWGVGASKMVMDPDSLIVKLLGTTAAHNEYLRIGVDGGYFGEILLLAMMTLWAIRWTRRANRSDKFIMRMVFICFAVHSVTDNTLISATASVLFAWVTAVFARSDLERQRAAPPPLASTAAHRRRNAAQIA
jgi:O-antigen ligase